MLRYTADEFTDGTEKILKRILFFKMKLQLFETSVNKVKDGKT